MFIVYALFPTSNHSHFASRKTKTFQEVTMFIKIFFILATLICYECLFLQSSFWAPLFNPRILGYKVDIPFNPDAGKNAREEYKGKYGVNGEKLIADLGNGRGPQKDYKDYGEVKVYYTYDGANKKDKRSY